MKHDIFGDRRRDGKLGQVIRVAGRVLAQANRGASGQEMIESLLGVREAWSAK